MTSDVGGITDRIDVTDSLFNVIYVTYCINLRYLKGDRWTRVEFSSNVKTAT